MRLTKVLTAQTRKNKIRRLEKHIKKVTRTESRTFPTGFGFERRNVSVCRDKNALEKLKILKSIL